MIWKYVIEYELFLGGSAENKHKDLSDSDAAF